MQFLRSFAFRFCLPLLMAVLAMLALDVPAFAQDFAPDIVAAGVAANQGSTPNAFGVYGHLISTPNGTYLFNQYSLTSVKFKPFAAQTSVRTGVAQFLRKVGPVSLFGVVGAGAAMAGNNVGGAISGGGFATVPIGKTKWFGLGSAELLQTSIGGQSHEYGVAIGRRL